MSSTKGIQENVEPNVIDIKMLEKALQDDFPTGEVGRLTKEEGVTFEEVKKINLEFLDILRIDCLWMLKSLTVLQLACNRIERLEGLESLTTLIELDLSFNNIEIIENISTLINLEVLALFKNKISTLENMETIQKLIIFNIGENCIEELNNVIYLRQFPELRSLNMAGNPCTEMKDENDFRQYICAFLPNLTYYEYRTILNEEREAANEVYRETLAKLKEDESEILERKAAAIKRVKELEFQKTAFIEELDNDYLFQAMFKNEPDGKALLKIDASIEPYEKFHDEMVVSLERIFQLGIEQHAIRDNEIKQYHNCVDKAQEENRVESTVIMDQFIEKKADIFFQIQNILKKVNELNVSEAEEEIYMKQFVEEMKVWANKFVALLQQTWYELMYKELILFEQMEEVNDTFERNMNELVSVFVEGAQGIFSQIRNLQQDYNEEITEVANAYLTQISVDKKEMPPELMRIMADKETLNSAIQSSHDHHMRVIDSREDQLVSRISSWCNNMCKNIVREEVKRNRNKVTEINNFLDLQREEYEELQTLPLEETLEELSTADDEDIYNIFMPEEFEQENVEELEKKSDDMEMYSESEEKLEINGEDQETATADEGDLKQEDQEHQSPEEEHEGYENT